MLKYLLALMEEPDDVDYDTALVSISNAVAKRTWTSHWFLTHTPGMASVNWDFDSLVLFNRAAWLAELDDDQADRVDKALERGIGGVIHAASDFELPAMVELVDYGFTELVIMPDRLYWEVWPRKDGRQFETESIAWAEFDSARREARTDPR